MRNETAQRSGDRGSDVRCVHRGWDGGGANPMGDAEYFPAAQRRGEGGAAGSRAADLDLCGDRFGPSSVIIWGCRRRALDQLGGKLQVLGFLGSVAVFVPWRLGGFGDPLQQQFSCTHADFIAWLPDDGELRAHYGGPILVVKTDHRDLLWEAQAARLNRSVSTD